LFGYRSPRDPYLAVGIGGATFAYSIHYFDPAIGWVPNVMFGNRQNLKADEEYNIAITVRGQRLLFEVNSVQILEQILQPPLRYGQLGLFAWGTPTIRFSGISVSQKPGTAFVIMQFSDPYHQLYEDVIKRVAEAAGYGYRLRAYHAGEVFGHGVILQDIIKGIVDARVIIAEVSEQNPNVYYELGYAHALNKPTILLAEKGKKPPFDISGYRHLFYDNSIAGKRKIEDGLRKHLEAIFHEPPSPTEIPGRLAT